MPELPDVLDAGGAWHIRADPDDVGIREGWWRGPIDSSWSSIDLPGAWQHVLGVRYDRVAWLRRSLEVPESWRPSGGARCWLRFDSVATDCRIWIDGQVAGRHVGDYVPFQVEICPAIARSVSLDIALRIDQIPAPRPAAPGALQGGHITKGFHDVISLAHGGVWQPVRLVRTGPVCAVPDGLSVVADASGRVEVRADLEPHENVAGHLSVSIRDERDAEVASAVAPISPIARRVQLDLSIDGFRSWSPRDPVLYTAAVTVDGPDGPSDGQRLRFGGRSVETRGHHILLNGQPIFLRGVLHWGHEPQSIAPASSPERVRGELGGLRERGFNAICLCMWYPPEHFFEIADELGMLVWQQHPVWQSPMRRADLPEYRRQYESFMRRDRRHTCVAIVSATCEHPRFDPDLAAWWWATARRELPRKLLQVQTAFFRWADLEHADLHDEHVYDNSDRWIAYLADVQDRLDELPVKPFVMGETVLFTSWPDTAGLRGVTGGDRPWWLPRDFDRMCRLDEAWTRRYGADAVARMRRQGERFALGSRRFQVEQFRRYERHAGLVMNHLRDVPACQCGFMDDLGRWRLSPESGRDWLGDRVLLLETPAQRRGFRGGGERALPCRALVSNFAAEPFRGPIEIGLAPPGGAVAVWQTGVIECPAGTVRGDDVLLALPEVDRPTRVAVTLVACDTPSTRRDLWVFPAARSWPAGAARLGGLPFTAAEREPDAVERAYSRGYGLPARRWRREMPDPGRLAPDLAPWPSRGMEPSPRVVVAHRLTRELDDFLRGGGRVVLLASKGRGGIGAVYESLYGQVPLIVEAGALGPGDSDWIVDMLVHDLVRSYCRVIPVEELGIVDQVDPLIRHVLTHDQPPVRLLDTLFITRVGDGLLIASSLDHGDDAGRYLLWRLVTYAARDDATTQAELDPAIVRRWVV